MGLGVGVGVVESFDVEVGLGTIVDVEGRSWPFHCTVIADGSRDIAVGTRVHFDRSWGGPGRWEAAAVTA
jgi:cold shock CspA family protein